MGIAAIEPSFVRKSRREIIGMHILEFKLNAADYPSRTGIVTGSETANKPLGGGEMKNPFGWDKWDIWDLFGEFEEGAGAGAEEDGTRERFGTIGIYNSVWRLQEGRFSRQYGGYGCLRSAQP
jgi:hypothetical protein